MNAFVLVILQARMSSNRLPGKVLKVINEKPMIYWQINRISQSKLVDKIIVATSDQPSDDILVDYLASIKQEYIRGSLNNVLDRFVAAEKMYNPSVTIRLTADCPLVMPEIIDKCIERFNEEQVDYVSNILSLTFPDGLDVEVLKSGVLAKLKRFKLSDAEKEHVTLGLLNRQNIFTTRNIYYPTNLSHFRWTVDTQTDLNFVREVFKHFSSKEILFTLQDMLDFIGKNPQLNQIKIR
jgi:spore coat polysaccharide biosynthesis protein SpsF